MMFERENTTERYYVDAHGPDDEALRAGFDWLLRFVGDHGHTRAAVFVPGLGQVESLGRVLGPQGATALRKDRKVQAGAVTIELLIHRGLPFSYENGPVLAVWVDDKQLDKLDGLRTPGLCAIPWVRTDIDGWKTNWNPTDVRTGKPGGSEDTVTNPVVVAALEALTGRVNLGTGLGHPSDRASAVQMFKALKNAREDVHPNQVRAWAVRHGWQADDARELGELAQKVKEGRAVRGSKQKMWRDDVVAIWREDASGG
jgi:hypothetical protein